MLLDEASLVKSGKSCTFGLLSMSCTSRKVGLAELPDVDKSGSLAGEFELEIGFSSSLTRA